jgi:hypothetical protein
MNRDGSDSVGVGGSGQHRGNPSSGDRDGNVAERERDMESGRSRRGPTPSSSTGPGGVISPLATRSVSLFWFCDFKSLNIRQTGG